MKPVYSGGLRPSQILPVGGLCEAAGERATLGENSTFALGGLKGATYSKGIF